MAGSALADLVVNISADIASLNTGMAAAGDAVNRFAEQSATQVKAVEDAIRSVTSAFGLLAEAATLGIGAHIFTDFVEGAVDAQAKLVDLATIAGTTASQMSAFLPAANAAGTSLDNVALASSRFSKQLELAISGTGPGAAALKALGISAEQAAKYLQDPAQGMLQFAQTLDKFQVSGNKAAAISTLLGRGGQQLAVFLKQLGQQTQLTATQTDAEVEAAHKLEDQWAALRTQGDLLRASISSAIVPALSQFLAAAEGSESPLQALRKTIQDLSDNGTFAAWASEAIGSLAGVVESIARVAAAMTALIDTISVLAAAARLVGAALSYVATASNPFASADALKQGNAAMQAALADMQTKAESAKQAWANVWSQHASTLATALAGESKNMAEFAAAAQKQAGAAKQAVADLAQNMDALDRHPTTNALFSGSQQQVPDFAKVSGALSQYQQALDALNKQAASASAELDDLFSGQKITEAEKYLAVLKATPDAWNSLTAAQKAAVEASAAHTAEIQRNVQAIKDQQTGMAALTKALAGYATASAAASEAIAKAGASSQLAAITQEQADIKQQYDRGLIDFEDYYAKQTDLQRQALGIQEQAAQQAVNAESGLAQTLVSQINGLDPTKFATLSLYQAKAVDLEKQLVEVTGKLATSQGALNDLQTKSVAVGSDYVEQWTAANSALVAVNRSLEQQVQQQNQANEAIGLTAAQVSLLKAAELDDAVAKLQEAQAAGTLTQGQADLLVTMQKQVDLLHQLAGAQQAGQDQQNFVDGWKNAFTSIANEGATFLENFVTKGSSAFKTLWEDFKTWALDAFAKIAAQTIIVNVAGAFSTQVAGIASNTFAGGSGGISSLLTGGTNTLGGASGLTSFLGLPSLSTAFTNLGTIVPTFTSSLSSGASVIDAASAAFAGTASSFAAAAIPILGVVAAVAGLSGLFNKKPSPVQGQFKVSTGTGGFEDNAYTPSLFGNLGFNDANTQQFSGQAAQAFNKVVAGAIDAFSTRFSAQQSTDFAAALQKTVFPTLSGTFTTQDFLQKYGGQVLQEVVVAAFKEIDPALASVAAGFKGTADQVATFGNTLLGIYDATKQINNSAFTSTIDAALAGADQATADKVLAFAQIVENFGAALPGVGDKLEALSATDIPKFIDALGGAQNALNAFSYLDTNFLTTAQQTALYTKTLSDDFASIGLKVPQTHQAFLDLLNSIDLTTAAGQKEYAFVLSLAPLYVKVYGTADQAATAVNNASNAMKNMATAAQQITVDVGTLTNAGIKQAQKLLSNIQSLAQSSPGDFGEQLSTQVSLIASAIKATGATLNANGSYYYPNPGGAAGEQTASYLDTLDQTYTQLTSDLARFTVLSAQYGSSQAQQLVQLEDWYTQQEKLFAGNSDALSALTTIYGEKWNAIIAGTAAGVSGVQDQLTQLQQSIAQYLQSLTVGNLSPLTPLQQLSQASQAYSQELGLAQGGDQAALGAITKYADTYLQQARGAFASSSDYTAIFDQVTKDLAALAGTNQAGLPLASTGSTAAGNATAQIAAALPTDSKLASSADVQGQTAAMRDMLSALADAGTSDSQMIADILARISALDPGFAYK